MKKISLLGILALLLVLGGCFGKKVTPVDLTQTGDVQVTGDVQTTGDALLGNENVQEVQDPAFMPVLSDDVAEVGTSEQTEPLDSSTQQIFDAYSDNTGSELTEKDIDLAEKVIKKVEEVAK